jgi:hypothetical protein
VLTVVPAPLSVAGKLEKRVQHEHKAETRQSQKESHVSKRLSLTKLLQVTDTAVVGRASTDMGRVAFAN